MKPILLGILPLLLSCTTVNATGINILSEEHHIQGVAGTEYYPHNYLEYDVSGTHPISASVSGEYYNSWSSIANPCASRASAGNFEIDVWAQYDSIADGTSIYTFTTDYNSLELNAFVYIESPVPMENVGFSLVDLTDSATILSYVFTNDGQYIYDFSLTEEVIVDPMHTYQLSMHAWAAQGTMEGGGTTAESRLKCSLLSLPQPVPEPSTALLFILGLAVLSSKCRLRRVS
jgi:hypothetical protein